MNTERFSLQHAASPIWMDQGHTGLAVSTAEELAETAVGVTLYIIGAAWNQNDRACNTVLFDAAFDTPPLVPGGANCGIS